MRLARRWSTANEDFQWEQVAIHVEFLVQHEHTFFAETFRVVPLNFGAVGFLKEHG